MTISFKLWITVVAGTLGWAAVTQHVSLAREIPLLDLSRWEFQHSRGVSVMYRGKQALKLTEDPAAQPTGNASAMALLKGVTFHDGTIEANVAGTVGPGANDAARGFIGLAFRVASGASHYEYIYLRPTNGRAEDQLRRNHSTQYASHPDWPWPRLRSETPGKYESYVDLEPGVWTRMRIVVAGTKARLYVHDVAQPCLIVDDLKLGGDAGGGIALWIGPGTEGYFADLKVTP